MLFLELLIIFKDLTEGGKIAIQTEDFEVLAKEDFKEVEIANGERSSQLSIGRVAAAGDSFEMEELLLISTMPEMIVIIIIMWCVRGEDLNDAN